MGGKPHCAFRIDRAAIGDGVQDPGFFADQVGEHGVAVAAHALHGLRQRMQSLTAGVEATIDASEPSLET